MDGYSAKYCKIVRCITKYCKMDRNREGERWSDADPVYTPSINASHFPLPPLPIVIVIVICILYVLVSYLGLDSKLELQRNV